MSLIFLRKLSGRQILRISPSFKGPTLSLDNFFLSITIDLRFVFFYSLESYKSCLHYTLDTFYSISFYIIYTSISIHTHIE